MGDTNLIATLAEIDAYIEQEKVAIERGKQLDALMQNENFVDVIINGYLKEEAERLFKQLTDPAGIPVQQAESVQLRLEAINHFKRYIGDKNYLGMVQMKAKQAPSNIQINEDYRKQVTAEAAEGEF